MNCEQAECLINAALDGELAADEAMPLDAHLSACTTCQETRSAVMADDLAIRQLFQPSRERAMEAADRAFATFLDRRRRRSTWAFVGTAGVAAAAGFVAALFLPTRPLTTPENRFAFTPPTQPVVQVDAPVGVAAQEVRVLFDQMVCDPADNQAEVALRCLGEQCVTPLYKIITSLDASADADARLRACTLVTDLSQPKHIPRLIVLLSDTQPQVRDRAEQSLIRLTGWRPGQNLRGPTLGSAPVASCSNPVSDWQNYWKQNHQLFGFDSPDLPE